MLATIPSATLLGIDGQPVDVEVHASAGIPSFSVVGLPDTSCRESKDRVRAALATSSLGFPNKRLTVNLAPSTIRKVGAGLDLSIAVGIAVAAGALPPESVRGLGFVGELGLDGVLRPVDGMLTLAEAVRADVVVVPAACHHEAVLAAGDRVRSVTSVDQLADVLRGAQPWPEPPAVPAPRPPGPLPDLADVRGQRIARFALEVAAAGAHHLLMVGPPGSGKTMLARRLPGLLPPLDDDAALEVSKVASAAGERLPPGGLLRTPPLRAPHHGASMVAMVGGGSTTVAPGEISLASRGVLFLDELGEFPAPVLDALRQPLEEGVIRVARAATKVTLPARFLLVGAMNPCPCGEGGPSGAGCRCSSGARARYVRRLSGPVLDRFDLRIDVARPSIRRLLTASAEEPTATVAARVHRARQVAHTRQQVPNGHLRGAALDAVVPIVGAVATQLDGALRAGRLSARGLARVRAVARTIADLAGDEEVTPEHVAQALSLRAEGLVADRLAG